MTSSLEDYLKVTSAVEVDNVTMLESLIAKGVDINANLDDEIGTALHVAARHDSRRCIDLLLAPERGALVELLATDRQQTPLMTAAQYGHVTVLRRLLEAGSDVNRQTDECSAALILASHYGHAECISVLLEHGANPRLMNRWQFNALYMSVDTPEILDRLLAGPAINDVNTPCGERKEVPLHLAAVIGSCHAILALLSAGADINARTIYNENALWLTAWQGQTEAASILIQNNIELDVSSNGCQVYVRHYLPLEVAAGLQHYVIFRMLLLAGCRLQNPHCPVEDNRSTENSSPAAPEVPWVRLNAEAFDYMRRDGGNIYSQFVSFVRNPVSLKDCCRRIIRRLLRTPLRKNLESIGLHLPQSIKDYVLMTDILDRPFSHNW